MRYHHLITSYTKPHSNAGMERKAGKIHPITPIFFLMHSQTSMLDFMLSNGTSVTCIGIARVEPLTLGNKLNLDELQRE